MLKRFGALVALIAGLAGSAQAASTVFNPFTGKPDFVSTSTASGASLNVQSDGAEVVHGASNLNFNGQQFDVTTGTSSYADVAISSGGVGSAEVADNSLLAADLFISGGGLSNGDVPIYNSSTGGFARLTPFTTYYQYLYFRTPDRVDGSGAVIGSTTTTRTYGGVLFSNSADETANWAEFTYLVPRSFDSNVDIRLEDLAIRLNGADTGTHRYKFSIATGTVSGSIDSPTFGSSVIVDITGDATGASADLLMATGAQTLTNWKGKWIPGLPVIIRVARDGNDASDGSTVDSTMLGFQIRYGTTHP